MNIYKRFTDTLKNSTKPFDDEIDNTKLFNIATGAAAPPHVEKFLLTCEKAGKELREKFVSECQTDNSRFNGQWSMARSKKSGCRGIFSENCSVFL